MDALDSHTTQGLTELHHALFSLSRLSRALKRAKLEAKVLCHSWDRHVVLSNVFGAKETLFVPGYDAAEWGFILYLIKTRSITRLLRLSGTTVGSVILPPLGILLYARFLLSTRVMEKVKHVGVKYAQRNKDADEEWWFINGTGVNSDLQAANGYHISEIFQKQVRLFYNPTSGLLFDFAQCAVGLLSYKTRPSTQLARSLLYSFSLSPTVKIILVVHSMGAIIACNAIKYLIRKGLTKDLYRLELYTFGSPSLDFLHVIDKHKMTRVPFYEHYVNTHDFFGSLGALRLADAKNWWAVGRVFTRDQKGHFFGEHYMVGLSQKQYTWRGSTKNSRLYSYMPDYPTPVAADNPYHIPELRLHSRRKKKEKEKEKDKDKDNKKTSESGTSPPPSSPANSSSSTPSSVEPSSISSALSSSDASSSSNGTTHTTPDDGQEGPTVHTQQSLGRKLTNLAKIFKKGPQVSAASSVCAEATPVCSAIPTPCSNTSSSSSSLPLQPSSSSATPPNTSLPLESLPPPTSPSLPPIKADTFQLPAEDTQRFLHEYDKLLHEQAP